MDNLKTTLEEEHIPVVIHKWMPDEKIVSAIKESGARLVILDTMDRMPRDNSKKNEYIEIMSQNLDQLARAFRRDTPAQK